MLVFQNPVSKKLVFGVGLARKPNQIIVGSGVAMDIPMHPVHPAQQTNISKSVQKALSDKSKQILKTLTVTGSGFQTIN